MNFTEKLQAIQKKQNSWVCVGLDTDPLKVPAHLQQKIWIFNEYIVDSTANYACAFKPNMAFYEAMGEIGLGLLTKIIDYIRKKHPDHLVILDAKRGDIGNTAEKYAYAAKHIWQADAVTVNPYLGPKTLQPFFDQGLGVIALCVTSNPDAAVFQNVSVITPDGSTKTMYQHIAKTLQQQFGSTGNLGLVTGATHPEELAAVRQAVGQEVIFLIPGIGKQGGDLAATLAANANGPAVINVSSSVIYASSGPDFAEAAGQKAEELRDQINAIRQKLNA